MGDNAQASLAPDLTSPFGKLLRLNDDGSIPSDNPHYNTQNGLARATWACGLRNPFTFAVQPGTGRSGPLYTYRHSAAAPLGCGPGGFFVGFAIAGGSFYPANGALGAPWRGNCFFAAHAQCHRALGGAPT